MMGHPDSKRDDDSQLSARRIEFGYFQTAKTAYASHVGWVKRSGPIKSMILMGSPLARLNPYMDTPPFAR